VRPAGAGGRLMDRACGFKIAVGSSTLFVDPRLYQPDNPSDELWHVVCWEGRNEDAVMAVKLNKTAFDHAKELIDKGKVVLDDRDAWSEHRPSARKENEFIRLHGLREYGKWYLGIDDEAGEGTKGRYKFPYGDFGNIHRCGVLTVESRAGQYKYYDIESAAAHLHGMIEAMIGATK